MDEQQPRHPQQELVVPEPDELLATPGKITRNPVLQRNHAYCLPSFLARLADWLVIETRTTAQHMAKTRARARAKSSSSDRPSTAPPTRVQPPRAAKQREPVTAAASSKKEKRKEGRDYILGLEKTRRLFGEDCISPTQDSLDKVVGQVSAAIAEKVAELRSLLTVGVEDDFAAEDDGTEGRERGPAGARVLRRCSVAHLPLGCADMVYCLHGLSMERKPARGKRKAPGTATAAAGAPEADMCAAPSCNNWQELGAVPDEDMSRQVVEVLGLCFAVDICRGYVKIAMM